MSDAPARGSRARPAGGAGQSAEATWRALAELRDAGAFREAVRGELPEGADRPPQGLARRDLLRLLGASVALAAAQGCSRQRTHKLLPYTVPPPGGVTSVPRFYATSMVLDGFAAGLLAESHDGRPTKLEGNPEHPASLGGSGVFEQASILELYDPHRAGAARRGDAPETFDAFIRTFAGERADRGAGLCFVLEPTGSPLLGELLARVHERHPLARFAFHAPARGTAPEEGARLVFGDVVQPQRDLRHADVVLALGSDFLASGPFSARYARDFAERRRVASPATGASMSRLYAVETMLTSTGSLADHRARRRPSEVPVLALSLLAELVLGLGRPVPGAGASLGAALAPFLGRDDRRFVGALARDLLRAATSGGDGNGGAAVVLAGPSQPAVVHATAHLLDLALGTGRASWLTPEVAAGRALPAVTLGELADDLARRRVDTVVLLEGNPSYTAPADLELGRWLKTAPVSVRLGAYEDETARDALWFLPAAHYLESWGDARAYDGTVSLIQPLLAPLRGGHTPAEVLAVFAGERFPDGHRLFVEAWTRRHGERDAAGLLAASLKRGFLAGSASPRVAPAPRLDAFVAALAPLAAPPPASPGYEVAFLPSPAVHDGRFANNPWLLELPDPTTKLTWDNAALLSPRSASDLGVADGDLLALQAGERRLEAPALIVPGHADGALTLYLGYGRTGEGEALARGVGFDAYRLRTSRALGSAPGLAVSRAGGRRALARTQDHFRLEGRALTFRATAEEYRRDPRFTASESEPVLSLYPGFQGPGEPAKDQWAMTIDTSICTGCSACVVACQAENNVLVVGKEGVLAGREMHWLRLDTYFEGPPEEPRVLHEPMLCQHCEKAPCEYVCPVNATVHSPDGLNEMVYNRCVGTRFCSNNCPYKVRRFNWFDFTEEPQNGGPRLLQHNPDVTVRQRGVMEKCTYCVQRIREAEIRSGVEQRRIVPGEVQTACQQACPTGAIQFGSLAHEGSKMVAWRAEPRTFSVLHHLGTEPRTRYLARLDNPNPELA